MKCLDVIVLQGTKHFNLKVLVEVNNCICGFKKIHIPEWCIAKSSGRLVVLITLDQLV